MEKIEDRGRIIMVNPVKKNSYICSIIITVVIVLGFADSRLIAGQERIIHFPKDRSIGNIYVFDEYPTDDFWSWMFAWKTQFLAEARGDVKVPANKLLRLDIKEQAWSKPEPFASIKSDDIQLSFALFQNVKIGKITYKLLL
jgi:hypothetical protein